MNYCKTAPQKYCTMPERTNDYLFLKLQFPHRTDTYHELNNVQQIFIPKYTILDNNISF